MKNNQKVTGAFVQFTDVTEQVEMKGRLNKRMEEMAVTLIPLSTDVVLLPLQPTFEQYDFTFILDKSLSGMAELKARLLIVDLSMIYETSPLFFEILEKLKKAARLLGIRVIISGVSPSMSKEWVHLNSNHFEITYFTNLKAALKVIKLNSEFK